MKYLAPLLFLVACASAPIDVQENRPRTITVSNDNYADAVIYVATCPVPRSCRVRLGDVTGNTTKTFRLIPSRHLTPNGDLQPIVHLVGGATMGLDPVHIGEAQNARILIGVKLIYSWAIPERMAP